MKKELLILINFGLIICCLSCHEAKQKQISERDLRIEHNKTYNLSELYKNNKTLFQAKYGRYYSLINQDGDVLIEKYDSISVEYKEIHQILNNILPENPIEDSGLTQIVINDKIGFVDQNGKIIVHPKYDLPEIYDKAFHSDFFKFNEGMIGVKYKGKWGFIDKTGKEVIPCKYDFAEPFSDGVTVVVKKGNWFIINKKGKEIRLSSKYSRVAPFVDGIAEVISNCGISHVDHGNDFYTQPAKCGYINKLGKEVIPLKYDYHCYVDGYSIGDAPFSGGIVLIELNNKFGFINKKGKKVTPIHYEEAFSFLNGVALVKLNNKWGYINKGGEEVISFKYDDAGYFSNGTAKVCVEGKCGLIDLKGKEITLLKYDDIRPYFYGTNVVTLNNKCGLVNSNGKEITLIKYDEIENLSNVLIKVEVDKKWGVINKMGKETTPIQYDDIIQIK